MEQAIAVAGGPASNLWNPTDAPRPRAQVFGATLLGGLRPGVAQQQAKRQHGYDDASKLSIFEILQEALDAGAAEHIQQAGAAAKRAGSKRAQ